MHPYWIKVAYQFLKKKQKTFWPLCLDSHFVYKHHTTKTLSSVTWGHCDLRCGHVIVNEFLPVYSVNRHVCCVCWTWFPNTVCASREESMAHIRAKRVKSIWCSHVLRVTTTTACLQWVLLPSMPSHLIRKQPPQRHSNDDFYSILRMCWSCYWKWKVSMFAVYKRKII